MNLQYTSYKVNVEFIKIRDKFREHLERKLKKKHAEYGHCWIAY